MTGFLVALQFLTRIRSPVRRPIAEADLGRSSRWFPLVGAVIGCIVATLDALLAPVATPELRAIAVVIALAIVTGALHLDGLMDSCDGLFAFTSPERRLEIMRDSRVGSFAVVGAATSLLLKYSAVLALPGEQRFGALICLGAASRWAMVFAAARYPSARSSGLSHALRSSMTGRELPIATALALLLVLSAGIAGLAALAAAGITTILLARYTLTKIPGLTGDVYGAICEIVEVTVAMVLPLLWRFTTQ
ncbi:MAG: adenosylcobinamide-GDP ribazoletransferase [Chloroflexi bacterium]|nr:adenosylcobinamide-GDP ribazoletransferase [Chloroflexota bacterium]